MPTWHKHYVDPKRGGVHVPEGLATVGAVLQVEVNLPQPLIEFLGQQGKPIPGPVSGAALIDTGASMTCVDESVLTSLGVNPIGLVTLGLRPARFSALSFLLGLPFQSRS